MVEYRGPLPFTEPLTLGDLWDMTPQTRAVVEHHEAEAAYARDEAKADREDLERAEDQNYQAQVTISNVLDLVEEARRERKVTVLRSKLQKIAADNRFEL